MDTPLQGVVHHIVDAVADDAVVDSVEKCTPELSADIARGYGQKWSFKVSRGYGQKYAGGKLWVYGYDRGRHVKKARERGREREKSR